MKTRSCALTPPISTSTAESAEHEVALRLRRDATTLTATHNQTGYISCYLDPVTDQFIRFAAVARATCLEIGAGFGAASLAAVRSGAHQAIVTDPESSHLTAHLPHVAGSEKCILRVGSVPHGISLPENSVDAILIARVLHFLPGRHVRAVLASCGRWLKPGGRLFVVCDSIHASQFSALRSQYKRRKQKLIDAPGYFERMQAIHKHRKNDLPGVFHYFECDTLQSFLSRRQFRISSLGYFGRPDYPRDKKKDGRECVGLIAEKL